MKERRNGKGISFLRRMKLGTRMSIFLGIFSFCILAGLLYFLIHSFEIALDKRIDDNMNDKAAAASSDFESVMTKAEGISDNISQGLQLIYSHSKGEKIGDRPENLWQIINGDYDTPKPTESMEPVVFKSQVVNRDVTYSQYIGESYILNSLYATLQGNDQLIGAGILFEPNAFLPGVKDYSPYISQISKKDMTVSNFQYDDICNEDYYAKVKETKEKYITDLYVEEEDGETHSEITFSNPVILDGEFKGTIITDVDASVIDSIQKVDDSFPSMFTNVLDSHGVIHSENPDYDGKLLKDILPEKALSQLQEGFDSKEAFSRKITNELGVDRREYFSPINLHGNLWWVRLSITETDYDKEVDRLVFLGTLFGVLSVILMALVMVVIIKKSLKPLKVVADAGKKMAEGDFDVQINYHNQDEIGDLMQSMQSVIGRIRAIISDLSEKLAELSRGNFAMNLE
ncbi:MAG: HAMP domain-containing protein, partial [Oribacterium parvum]|nr:HAMP domain-containing protein [Oribacterium parvum]